MTTKHGVLQSKNLRDVIPFADPQIHQRFLEGELLSIIAGNTLQMLLYCRSMTTMRLTEVEQLIILDGRPEANYAYITHTVNNRSSLGEFIIKDKVPVSESYEQRFNLKF